MELYPVYDRQTDTFLYYYPAKNPEEVYTEIGKN